MASVAAGTFLETDQTIPQSAKFCSDGEVEEPLGLHAANSYLAVILGAGRPFRGMEPSALASTPDHRRVLDWLLEAFATVPADIHYVGGYQLEDVARHVSNFTFSVNPEWQSTGSVGTLFVAPLSAQQSCIACYSDVVFTKMAVDGVCEAAGDVVLAVDRTWRQRYSGRTRADLDAAEKVRLNRGSLVAIGTDISPADADAEFIGLAKFSPQAVKTILALRASAGDVLRKTNLPVLVDQLLASGLRCNVVDVGGNWAELNAPQDLARFVLGTKAETLDALRPVVRECVVCDQVRFTTGEWAKDRARCLDNVVSAFGPIPVVVRSSTLTEDSWLSTCAGAFLSVLDVPCGDREQLTDAIERVIASYGDDNADHQVLVQEMVENVQMSGVAFTRSLNFGAPYYTINYDNTTSSTETVTSGVGTDLKTLVLHRSVQELSPDTPPALRALLPALREVESLIGHDSLDIEFAINRDGTVFLLQVRPIAVDHSAWRGSDEAVESSLEAAEKVYRLKQTPPPFTHGERTVFGVMPDWNPAEIIGTSPRRLALSLYRYLFTDEVWAAQRAAYGYRDVRPQPLMITLAGHPYIDVRASFNSFIPADLPDELGLRLVNHYLEHLRTKPELHDKIEFDIAFTCLTLDFDQQATRLHDAGFSPDEIDQLRQSLRGVTKSGLTRSDDDMRQIAKLETRFDRVMRSSLPPLERACVLLEDCRRYGALPFSHLARSGFVAVALLRSAVARGIMSSDQVSVFLNSLNTVAKQLTHDAKAVVDATMTSEAFCAAYGHLRPGTYDITTPSYADDAQRYLLPIIEKTREHGPETTVKFEWDEQLRSGLSTALREAGLPEDIDLLDRFFRQAIEGRERAKFAFTRNLSAALDSIAEFGNQLGISRHELANISLEDFQTVRSGNEPPDLQAWLLQRAEEGQSSHNLSEGIELPPLITAEQQIRTFHYSDTQPNFITSGKVVSEIVSVSESCAGDEIAGKIVVIPQADPGYDWLFGYEIAGLITTYGGANSHMAIRAAEFQLPAAIGVGEVRYGQLTRGTLVSLDCQNRRIDVIR